MKTAFLFSLAAMLYVTGFSQNVGIGTLIPLARLHVIDSSVVFSASGLASGTPGNPPISNDGRRLMWYSDKAAFRAGYISGVQWNRNSVGNYSTAMGYNSTASCLASFSMGNTSQATGPYSIAMGYFPIASGSHSIAIGNQTNATLDYSIAIGVSAKAFGFASLALGNNTIASGTNSTTMGTLTQAIGLSAT